MRLIDADALISFIHPEHLRNSGELTFSEIDVINMLNHAPTAFDVDKVVEMLEEECFSPIDYPGYAVDIEKAIEIVEEGGVDGGKRGKSEDAEELRSNSEATSKWVPCSERLPKKSKVNSFDSYIVQCRRVMQPFSAYWDGKALVARNENFVPTQDMYITGVRNENFIINKTYNDIVYPAVYVGAKALQYEPYREQLLTLPYTLNAIPVSSDGNVTIDGQQYIADRVVEKDGVFGIERNTAIDVPVLTKTLRETPDMKGRFVQDGAFKKIFTPFYESLVNIGYSKICGVAGSVIDKWIFGVNKANFYISPPKDLNYTSEDIFNALKDLNIKVYGALLVPFFEPLPGDIQAKLRTLVTNYPVTNISVTSDQLDGYTVFNYPISMANGWNYVKQQLNDNRDYIYDMDIQSAEAYVNSEYAVALTELEV